MFTLSHPPASVPPRCTGAVIAVPAISATLLVVCRLAEVPEMLAVAAAASLAASVPATMLLWLARRPCRSAALLGVGVLVAGATPLALAFGAAGSMGSMGLWRVVASTSMVVSMTTLVTGLLLLAAPTAPTAGRAAASGRLRLLLDGLCVAAPLLFSGWLLMVGRLGALPAHAIIEVVLTCVAVTVVAIRSVLFWRVQWPVAACGGGVAMSIVGLAGLAVAASRDAGPGWATAACACLLVGPSMTWFGVAETPVEAADPPLPSGPPALALAGRPVMVLPALLGLLTAAYHVLTGGALYGVATGLAIVTVAALVARHALLALDIAGATRLIAAREAQFRGLIADSSDVAMVLDAGLVVRWQSPAALRQFGLSDADVVGSPFTALLHPDDAATAQQKLRGSLLAVVSPALLEARLRGGGGEWLDTESTISNQRYSPEVGGLVLHVRDVTERKELERTVRQMGVTDILTGLANRTQVLRVLDGWPTMPTSQGAVLLVGLDGLAEVNVARGPELGDAALVEAAQRLRGCLGDADMAARWSGNELLVITRNSPVRAYALATMVVNLLGQAYHLPGNAAYLTAHVGLADLAGGVSSGEVLRQAGIALRRARHLGHSGLEWYDEVMEAALLRRLSLEKELPGAATRGELDVVYQPIVDLSADCPVGVEALVRWRHPRCGTVSPAELVPVAEDLDLIGEIGEWVLHKACRQLASWRREGYGLWLAVNLSPRQLAAPGFVSMVETTLRTYDAPAERLVVELAEPSMITDAPFLARLAELRALGVRVALDRFGAGQISMAQLQRLPVDVLKLDQAFLTEPAARSVPATPMIDVMVGLGRRLGFEIITSGIETAEQLESVRAAGCRYGQGYVLSRPAPAERVEAYLESHRSPSL